MRRLILTLAAMGCAAQALGEEIVTVGIVPAALTIHGPLADDPIVWRGTTAVGDLNLDGFPDLVIAIRDGDGPASSRTEAGEVHGRFGPFTDQSARDIATEPAEVLIYGYGVDASSAVPSPWRVSTVDR